MVFPNYAILLGAISLGAQRFVQRVDEAIDARDLCVIAHHPYAPDFAGERTESAAHLDAHPQQASTHDGFIDARGNVDHVDGRTTIRRRRKQRKPEAIQSTHERVVRVAMSLPSRLEAFLENETQRFVKS